MSSLPLLLVRVTQICFSLQKFELNISSTVNILRSDVAWLGIVRNVDTVAFEAAHTNFPPSLAFITGTKWIRKQITCYR